MTNLDGNRRGIRDCLTCGSLETPAQVFDKRNINCTASRVTSVLRECGCNTLFALKALAFADVVYQIADIVDGFAASSLFEARLARETIGSDGTVHFTSPGLRPEEAEAITDLCDYISFNSLWQLSQFRSVVKGNSSCGLRINPQHSFVGDDRYDPCRRHSKLGVPLDELARYGVGSAGLLKGISGVHFHNNTDSSDFRQLFATIQHLDAKIGSLLSRMTWINVGGGYLFDNPATFHYLSKAIELLTTRYGLEVFMEPGAAIVRSAGYLISSVIDMFKSDGKTIAILDSTVNHWPEVFEYQFEPDVEGHVDDGPYTYLLAGCSCLAGDLFGTYSFNEPLKVGSRVVFRNAGAYSIVKAHMFNGINLPSIYAVTEAGELVLIKRFAYEDFLARCGVDTNAAV